MGTDDDGLSVVSTRPSRRRLCGALAAGTAGLAGCIRLTTSGESGTRTDGSGDRATEAAGTDETGDDGSGSGGDADPTAGEPIAYDFETAAALGAEGLMVSEDTGRDVLRRTDRFAHTGEFSVGIEGVPPDVIAAVQPFGAESVEGRRIGRVSYAWLELEESYGGGVRLLNSDGGTELFAGTDNPEWITVTDGDPGAMSVVYEGGGYERWVQTTATFDWDAGTATVRFRDAASGTERERTVQLGAGVDVAAVTFEPFASLRYEGGDGFRNDSCYMFWDTLEIRP
jgi:hypothetical protein